MACTYTSRFPHVNCDPVSSSHTEVIPWHSPADEVFVDVWCDHNPWRDRDSTPSPSSSSTSLEASTRLLTSVCCCFATVTTSI